MDEEPKTAEGRATFDVNECLLIDPACVYMHASVTSAEALIVWSHPMTIMYYRLGFDSASAHFQKGNANSMSFTHVRACSSYSLMFFETDCIWEVQASSVSSFESN